MLLAAGLGGQPLMRWSKGLGRLSLQRAPLWGFARHISGGTISRPTATCVQTELLIQRDMQRAWPANGEVATETWR